mgnify:CR=1 FL=1
MMKNNRRLQPQALYHSCDLSQFDFKTTADIEPLDQPLGQQRALEAIEFGVDIDDAYVATIPLVSLVALDYSDMSLYDLIEAYIDIFICKSQY